MIYGTVREKMEEIFKIFYFSWDPKKKKNIFVYTTPFTQIDDFTEPFFKYDAEIEMYEFRGIKYSEIEFIKILDLLIFI